VNPTGAGLSLFLKASARGIVSGVVSYVLLSFFTQTTQVRRIFVLVVFSVAGVVIGAIVGLRISRQANEHRAMKVPQDPSET
jgi:uncharacterized protein (DUF697 family)